MAKNSEVLVAATPAAWAGTTAYVIGNRRTNGGNIYEVIVAGTSAASGGPTGTGADILDGTTLRWKYIGPTATASTTPLPAGAYGRRFVLIQNYGPNPIHVGFQNDVAAGKGVRVPAAVSGAPGSFGPIELGATVGIWAKADTADQVAGAATAVLEW